MDENDTYEEDTMTIKRTSRNTIEAFDGDRDIAAAIEFYPTKWYVFLETDPDTPVGTDLSEDDARDLLAKLAEEA